MTEKLKINFKCSIGRAGKKFMGFRLTLTNLAHFIIAHECIYKYHVSLQVQCNLFDFVVVENGNSQFAFV